MKTAHAYHGASPEGLGNLELKYRVKTSGVIPRGLTLLAVVIILLMLAIIVGVISQITLGFRSKG